MLPAAHVQNEWPFVGNEMKLINFIRYKKKAWEEEKNGVSSTADKDCQGQAGLLSLSIRSKRYSIVDCRGSHTLYVYTFIQYTLAALPKARRPKALLTLSWPPTTEYGRREKTKAKKKPRRVALLMPKAAKVAEIIPPSPS